MESAAPPPAAHATCEAFGLGAPVEPLVGVSGGGTHRLWRLTTTRGVFAVKALNRDFENPDYVGWYERAFPVELAAFDARVPMAHSMTGCR